MKKKRKYIYLEKCLIIRILQIYIFSFYDFLFFISLSDAKMLENILQHLIGRDFPAHNLCQVEETLTEVL